MGDGEYVSNTYQVLTWDQITRSTAENPFDGPSRLFLDRCRHLEETPPTDWTEITAFLEK